MGPFFSKPLPLPAPNSLTGQTILITGSNTGLGLAAAHHALELGASTLILAVRSVEKGLEAREGLLASRSSLASEGGKDVGIQIHVWELDLASFASVRSFVKRIKTYTSEEGGKLDAAVMNAGIASVEWNTTADGWERSLQVNVLSLALLGLELLPLLLLAQSHSSSSSKANPKSKPHLTVLASDIHKTVKFPERLERDILSSLNTHSAWQTSQKLGGPTERYAVTKLLDIYVTQTLAEIVPRDTTKNNKNGGDPAVIVNCVAPGFCKSNLLSREAGIPGIVKVVQWVTGRSVEEGGKTIVDALVRGVESHGAWMEDLAVRDPGEIMTGPDMARVREQVWGEIVDVLRVAEPGLRTEY